MPKKRRSQTCIQCSKRKVRCDKKIPCKCCIDRGIADQCRRPLNTAEIYTEEIHNDLRKSAIKRDESFVGDNTLENYMSSIQSITFGYSQMNGLPSQEKRWSSNDLDSASVKLDHAIARLDYDTSHMLCLFACKYTTFLHFAVVGQLFMADHASFWGPFRGSLFELLQNRVHAGSDLDFNYWMSLYYAMLCTGVYFGADNLRDELQTQLTNELLLELPKVFFHASLTSLRKTSFLERPDIRCVQIYGVMTVYLHSLGNTFLHKQMLGTVIAVEKVLRMDRIREEPGEPTNFHKELAKRLWYSFFIVDSLSNVPHRIIGEFTTPYPRLLTTAQLLGQVKSKSSETFVGAMGEIGQGIGSLEPSGESLKFIPATDPEGEDDIAGLIYQRLMSEMAEIKQISYHNRKNLKAVSKCWHDMNHLLDNLDKYFGSAPFDINNRSISQFAKFLMFSSLSKESFALGGRILSLTGRNIWAKNFRKDCLRIAIDLVRHNAYTETQPYYKHLWLIGQHLIYACLFILLDMLMFNDDWTNKFEVVTSALPSMRKLRVNHFNVRVGMAVIEKLSVLVKSVRSRPTGASSVEDISLHQFLKDLEVAGPHPVMSDAFQMPPIIESQYLRHGLEAPHYKNPEESGMSQWNVPLSASWHSILDPELGPQLNDTGWYEFLDFFFGNQNN